MTLKLRYKICEKDANKSLKNFLKKQDLSRKAITTLKHQGGKICINAEEKTTRFMLTVGDVVTITFPDEPVSNTLLPFKMDMENVYEDDFLLVVDKKEGLTSVPSGFYSTSLANGILAYYEDIGLKSTVHFVNRLDKGTSGLLVVAKHRHIHHLMTVDAKSVKRKYYALISGILKDFGCVDAPIARLSADSVKRSVHPSGKRAITNYEAIEHFEDSTLVRCTLETGRTHQIRVHMDHLGHPILKDPLYGDGECGDKQLLHSYFLEFVHPITRDIMSFETEVPNRFGQFMG